MKSLTSRVSLFLAVFFSVSVFFSACSSSKKEGAGDTELEIIEDIFETGSGEKITLTFCFPGDRRPSETDIGKVLEQLEVRMKGTLNYDLDFQFLGSYYSRYKIPNAINNNEPGDVYFCPSYYFYSLNREGLLLDLTELFPRYAPTYYSKFSEEDLAEVTIDGKIVAIPPNVRVAPYSTYALVRQDLMEKYNIPGIKTMEDFEHYMETIKENEPNTIPAFASSCSMFLLMQAGNYVPVFGWSIVMEYGDPEYRLMPFEQTEIFRSGIETFKRWKNQGYLTTDKDFGLSLALGTVASYIGDWESVQDIARQLRALGKFKIYPMYPDNFTYTSLTAGGCFVLSKNTKVAEHVLRFIDWLQSDQESYDLLMYGIYGEHYEMVNGEVTFPKGTIPYHGWEGSQAFANIDYVKPLAGDPPEFREILSRKTDYVDFEGLELDESLMDRVNDIERERNRQLWEIEEGLGSGTYPDVSQFIESQRAAGIDDLIADAQRAIDQWRKNKTQ